MEMIPASAAGALATIDKKTIGERIFQSVKVDEWNVGKRDYGWEFAKSKDENYTVKLCMDKWAFKQFTYWGDKWIVFAIFTCLTGPVLLSLFYPGSEVYVEDKVANTSTLIKLSFRERWALRLWFKRWLREDRRKQKEKKRLALEEKVAKAMGIAEEVL